MKSQMKSLVKKVVRSAGYDLRRRANAVFPYTRAMDFAGHKFNFWIADDCGRLWYQQILEHMRTEAQQLDALVRPGDRVLEIGCHHGLFTVFLAQSVGPTGSICAVEASPENAMIAQAQVTLNQLGARAAVLHAAGSDVPGSLAVQGALEGGNNCIVGGDGRGGAAVGTSGGGGGATSLVEVQAVTGDQLDERYGPFTVLKLDVEGFEAMVLKGCSGLLKRRPRVAIEVHGCDLPRYGSSVEEVLRLLHIEDYKGYLLKRPDYKLEPLKLENIAGNEPVNLFLEPK